MSIIREFKMRSAQIAGPVIGITIVAYFAYHAVQGDRGLLAYGLLRQDVETRQALVLDVRATRMYMEGRVQALRPESLDPDLLEERARLFLGYGYPDDVVLIRPKADIKPQIAVLDVD